MSSEFLKSLIALLAQSGGSCAIPLTDLQQLGIELTIDGLGSPDALLRLRLGPKIYYVPEKSQTEAPCPTTPKPQSTLDQQIEAVNQLNNRPRYVAPKPLPSSDESSLESPTSVQPSRGPSPSHLTEAGRQEGLTGPPPPQRRVVPKSDMDLFLREQEMNRQKELSQTRKQRAERQRSRQYPWETRNAPPLKLQ